MRYVLTFCLILLAAGVFAQIKGSGILYWNSFPTSNASLPSGSEWSYVLSNKTLYYWDRDSTAWLQYRAPGRVFEIATVADTTTVQDFREGSMFVTPAGAIGIRASNKWKVIQSSATNSIYVGSGNIPPSTTATVLNDFKFQGTGTLLQLVNNVLNLQATNAINLVGPVYVDLTAPAGDTVLIGSNSAGRLIKIPSSYFPSFEYVDSLAASISGLDSAYSLNDTLFLITPTDTFTVVLPAPDSIDATRQILRTPTVGTTPLNSLVTATEWINWWYFAPPTMSLAFTPSTTVYEVGTTNSITISGSTTNPGSATLSSGVINRTTPSATTINSFGSSTGYSTSISFEPRKDSTAHYKQLSYSFRAQQNWTGSGESGTAQSSTITVQAVYPVLYGMSTIDLSSTGNAYVELTKLVQTEGNKQVNLNGSGYIYYAVPATWSDFALSSIIDHNGFNVTGSFTAYTVNVTSTGLDGNWTQSYRLYKLNTLTTTSNFLYTFNR